MKLTNQSADKTILAELGTRFAKARLDQNLTQAKIGHNAGVSKRTVERLEAGESVQLVSLIRLCRALKLVDRLELMFPESPPSPIAQLKLRGKTPQRARPNASANPAPKKWSWGDRE